MTITIQAQEYDQVHGCTECVHFGDYTVPSLDARAIRRFLAEGDYSEGGDERRVDVYHGERLIGSWTAPEIRRIAAALRGAAKRTGKLIVTGC